MPRPSLKSSILVLAAALATTVLAATISACGGSTATNTTAPGTASSLNIATIPTDPAVAALLPASTSKTIELGTNLDQVQLPYVGTPSSTGLQADLRTAVGRILGVSFDAQNSTFAEIIPGIQSGKYTIGMANFGVTASREKVLDFVTYFNDGQSFVESSTTKLSPITGPGQITQLCGKTVVTAPGTTFQGLIASSQASCTSAGKPAIKLALFDSLGEIVQALQEGRADIYFGPTAGNRYLAAHTPGLTFLSQYSTTPVGFVLNKGSALDRPLQAAINALIANGDYAKILAKWDVGSLGVTTAQINPTANF